MNDKPDDNYVHMPRDFTDRRRLNPNLKEKKDERGRLEVEDFSTPSGGFGNSSGKDDPGAVDSNYVQVLRDLEERRRLAGGNARITGEQEKRFAVEDFSATNPFEQAGMDARQKSGANDENFTQLMYDIADRRKLAPTVKELGPVTDEELLKSRFETIPAKAISEHDKSRSGSSGTGRGIAQQSGGSYKKSSGNDYARAYQQQQNQSRDAAAQKRADENKAFEKRRAVEKANEQKTFRARELSDQIKWWKDQIGQGRYDDATIAVSVYELQRELDGIPDVFKK